MKTFRINELGCKVNQYESQLLREQMAADGLKEITEGPADVYLINTCTVTAKADSDSRRFLRRALRENSAARIIAAGCYAENNAGEILKICKDAIIVKNRDKKNTLGGIRDFAGHNRAFIKIEDGCENFCSYCKVPLVRGRVVNRPQGDIIAEAGRLAQNGFKEIVLCGICLGAWGDLRGLLERLEAISGLERIRLSSLEPIYVTEGLVQKIASSEKLCRHLHIPLQSGDDNVLKAMNRNYTVSGYISLIGRIRAKIPHIAISTDVLVGFPGETENEFKNTMDVISRIKPMRTHTFSFSRREGTKAFSMPGEPDKKEKSRRAGIIRRLGAEFASYYAKSFQDRVVCVLVESGRDKKTGMLTGYTDTYIKVLFKGPDELINELARVKISKAPQSHAYALGILDGAIKT